MDGFHLKINVLINGPHVKIQKAVKHTTSSPCILSILASLTLKANLKLRTPIIYKHKRMGHTAGYATAADLRL